ncbi:hypothetical protein C0993_000151 [Termitomyces sp. T159_Od127]|nr:hypothetical protein C0993_000151 [Termitomyces sp. T159_Od127]
MASHLSAQHAKYAHSAPQNNREEDALRLPSIKDLGFRYSSRRAQDPQDLPSHASPTSIAPADTSINRDVQDNSARWGRPSFQPQSPAAMPAHLQQHQPQHHHHHQQLTPPLSAGHEPPQLKNEFASKPDGPFMTPGLPLSVQSVHGAVTMGPGTRGDEADQSKRRRSSVNMSTPRDQRSNHTAYPPHYAQYPPSQPPQQAYQIQTMPHPGPPVQQPIDHVATQQVAPPHPGYSTYQPQYPPPPSRVQLHSAPQQQQVPPPGNPYPAAPVPPHSPWEQAHHAQPPHQHQPQPPPPPQLQQPPPPPPPHLPPPQHTSQIQQNPHSMPQHPHPQPPPPPTTLLPQHHHMHPQHPQHPQPHQPQQPIAPPPLGHHPHPHSQPQSHQSHQAPPQIQQPQIPYARTTAIVPIDTRSQYPVAEERMPLSARESTMNEIMKHCQVLFDFASRYAQIQQSMPEVSPPPEEIQEMSHLAVEVVRLLEEYRRLNLPESERVKMDNTMAMTPPDDHRPPKRPWEDMSQQDENSSLVESATFAEQQYPTPVENKLQSTAEQDMEIIRNKRATSTAGGSGSSGQPKSKYRKRSRATPPGKCHSCNIRETPEWRRGPDGARTLCNACGLHYAKLQRKREKQAGPNGEVARIDMETLRASARAAEIDKTQSRSKNGRSQQSNESTSPMESGKPLPQQHHQSSFQLVPMVITQETVSVPPPPPPPPPSQQQQPTMGSAPTPPWQTSVQSPSTVRAYAPDQLQHQSFMRTSHQATNHTPAR